jgi:hypothetical protein
LDSEWPFAVGLDCGFDAFEPTRMRLLPFLSAVLVGSACATAEIPPVQGPAAAVKIGKSDPTPDMQEIGPIEARNGSGCGAFGELGSYDGALAVLRNNAATMGGLRSDLHDAGAVQRRGLSSQ